MGDKARAKACARDAGVPTIPGAEGEATLEDIRAFCAEHGFPAVIKAVAGGGGRGMRVVRGEAEISGALEAAQREAERGVRRRPRPRRALPRPHPPRRGAGARRPARRAASTSASASARCSAATRRSSRRHPPPPSTTRCAPRWARRRSRSRSPRGYEGAGTVELVLGDEGFFFLEMNTRLQVEHPVTEAVFGVDLVEEQLRIAAGEPLRLRQAELRPRGHAVEARVYAEDPANAFLPSGGRILAWRPPSGEGVRVDAGVAGRRRGDRPLRPAAGEGHRPRAGPSDGARAARPRARRRAPCSACRRAPRSPARCWPIPTSAPATWTRGCSSGGWTSSSRRRPTTCSRPPRSRPGSPTRRR